jgi:multicomponent Na+:H+ antiporter subunit F
MFYLATACVLLSMGLVVVRAILGYTVYDRMLAANQFGTNTVIAICLLVFIFEDSAYLDIALVYALINFSATIAFLRYYQYGSFKEEGYEQSD